jgi:hypothetical protein
LFSRTFGTLKRSRVLILVIGALYFACIGGGVATSGLMPERMRAAFAAHEARSSQGVEKIFGQFRGSVREGHWGVIAACSGLVFLINLAGDFIQFTLLSILIVPAAFTLGVGGWLQGISLAGVHASSALSLGLFLFMGGLEWITYVLATAAGVNIGLSVLRPKRQAAETRSLAFQRAWGEAGRLYLVIIVILAVQAVFEMLYVRKVLLMGGSGVPLMPY